MSQNKTVSWRRSPSATETMEEKEGDEEDEESIAAGEDAFGRGSPS